MGSIGWADMVSSISQEIPDKPPTLGGGCIRQLYRADLSPQDANDLRTTTLS